MTVTHGPPQGNIKFRGIGCLNVRPRAPPRARMCACVAFRSNFAPGPTSQDSFLIQKGKRLLSHALFPFLSLPRPSAHTCALARARVCVTASALFAIFYFAWKMLSRGGYGSDVRACPLNRMLQPFRCAVASILATENPPRYTHGALPSSRPCPPFLASPARSWQVATDEDNLSLYFTGRSSSSNKGISFFFPFPLSLPLSLFLSLCLPSAFFLSPFPHAAVSIHLA